MCFGRSSLKGDKPSTGVEAHDEHLNSRPAKTSKISTNNASMPSQQQSHQPPQGPPPDYTNFNSNNLFASPSGPPPSAFSPPAGPPPSQHYSAPSGPPPSSNYGAPPGPPPSSNYGAPPGPPPQQKQEEKQQPYHDWQNAVPDTSLLPPPPSMGEDRSWANNATESDAERGLAWTNARPLVGPGQFPSEVLEAVEAGDVELMRPNMYVGSVRQLRRGVWSCAAKQGSPDSCLMSTIPLYSVNAHNPINTRRTKTIYYEVAISPKNRSEVTVGIGYVAQPYPPFRLPGWDRAGLGVHGDDGHKYVHDMWGGKSFTTPFKPGEVVGIGMTFKPSVSDAPPAYGGGQPPMQHPIDVEVFFTRNGEKAGGWNIHEERDEDQDRPVTGLEGWHDLFAAVGTFEKAEFEVRFDEKDWMFRPDMKL